MVGGLLGVLAWVLGGPFISKRIERNLELFFFFMGVIAISVAWTWSTHVITQAIAEPVLKGIVPAVLIAGLLFHYGSDRIRAGVGNLARLVPLRILVFGLVVGLSLLSSIFTAIIASLVLVEAINVLPMERAQKVRVTITACFGIGLGAALTPVGEPLSTIAIGKLQGEPYHAGFFFLFDTLGVYILSGIILMGLVAAIVTGKTAQGVLATKEKEDGLEEVVKRAIKVYLFVAALILLGAGFEVLIERFLTQVPARLLYWANMLSAILDNATLAAAEISPRLSIDQIVGALMGLLISGGMLIPGNIPNIISADKLGIGSKEWARFGVPLGLSLMLAYFLWLFYF